MRTKSIIRALTLLLLLALVPAHATFHFMKIVEIFPGTAASPSAQYVVIQMHASGQQFVGGHQVTVFDAAGTQIAAFQFPGDVANGANQAKILIATTQAQSFFGVGADLVMSAALLQAGGKVCFAGSVDCVAWGSYSGSPFGVGTPFNAAGGLESGRAAIRRLDIAGSAFGLDDADDTNDCANDFVFGLPAPVNNAGASGTIPASSCGNGAVEGLEQCDDGNLVDGDGCSSVCKIDMVIGGSRANNDFNGDGRSDVFWRNTSDGRNAIWNSGDAATPLAVTGVSNLGWAVVGAGDFDGDGRSDVFWRNTSDGRNAIWKSANAATPQPVTTVGDLGWKVAGVGDFDGDDHADVFWRHTGDGRNEIWKSGNASTSQAVTGIDNLDWVVVGVGDFDGDDNADVFWRNTNDGRNAVWRSGNAATSLVVTGVGNPDWKVVGVGDFDGDDRDDVFWRNTNDGRNTVWRSANAATPRAVLGISNPDWIVAEVGDFDGDDRDDVFWRNTNDGRNTIWKSANAVTPHPVIAITNLAWTIVPYEGQSLQEAPTIGDSPADSDFDGDGRSDVFWRNIDDGRNTIWKSANAATPQAATGVSNLAWAVVGVGDFDGDGRADVFWRNISDGRNTIWESADAATPQAVTGITNLAWTVVGVGDFDGDGRADVFWRDLRDGRNAIWRSANAATALAVTGVGNLDWKVVGVGDFDGDGRADVLWRNIRDGRNTIWKSGNAATPQAVTGIGNPDWRVAGVGDFDGDGRADVFWRNINDGRNTIWKSGNATTPQAVTGVGNPDWRVASVSDFDGDGRADVFWRNVNDGRNTIWKSGNAATPQSVVAIGNPAWIIVPYEGPVPAAVPQTAGPSLSIADVSVSEGNSGTGSAIFTVRLSYASTDTVTYNISTANGTATAGSDYAAANRVGEGIAAGQLSKAFAVTINGDTADEPDETFNVNVGNVSGATVSDGRAQGIIRDDDYNY